MRRVGKGFSGVDTPLFDGMLVPQQVHDDIDVAAEDEDAAETTPPSPTLLYTTTSTRTYLFTTTGKIAELDADEDVTLEEVAAEVTKDADDDEIEPAELKELIEVVTTAKLMTEVVTAIAATNAATIITTALMPKASAPRGRSGVIIHDPEETATPSVIVHSEPKTKDKGKGILVEEPEPVKRQAQIEQDEAYARELEAELNANINWNEVIEQVKRKEKKDNAVMRYQSLKRKPVTEAQARKNMMVYPKNMAGFKIDFFKGMSYTDIRPIFKKHFNSVVAFLEKGEEELKEEASKQSKRKSESFKQQAAKKQRIDEEVFVVDYQIHTEHNKPYYKIIRADGTHQLFLSFISLLRNFDIKYLEMLWKIVQERFASSEPKNFSNDFLLNAHKTMFEKPNVEANGVRYEVAKICKKTAARRIQTRVKSLDTSSIMIKPVKLKKLDV
nr:hypothetical protein [Tanacetum cinerariifolium]